MKVELYNEGEQAWSAIGAAFAVADGNISVLGIFNPTTSPYRLMVDRFLLSTASLTTVSGVGIEINIRRLSNLVVGSGAAAVLIGWNREHQTGGDLKQHVTAFTDGTPTLHEIVGYAAVNNDELPITGQSFLAERELWTPALREFPLVLPPGQGVEIFQVTADTAGAWIPRIDFRASRQKG